MPISRYNQDFNNCVMNLINQPMLLGYPARPRLITIVFQTFNFADSGSRMHFEFIQ